MVFKLSVNKMKHAIIIKRFERKQLLMVDLLENANTIHIQYYIPTPTLTKLMSYYFIMTF